MAFLPFYSATMAGADPHAHWHSAVTEDARRNLILSLYEAMRLQGNKRLVWDSAATFEIGLWSTSKDAAAYVTAMQRRIRELRGEKEGEPHAEPRPLSTDTSCCSSATQPLVALDEYEELMKLLQTQLQQQHELVQHLQANAIVFGDCFVLLQQLHDRHQRERDELQQRERSTREVESTLHRETIAQPSPATSRLPPSMEEVANAWRETVSIDKRWDLRSDLLADMVQREPTTDRKRILELRKAAVAKELAIWTESTGKEAYLSNIVSTPQSKPPDTTGAVVSSAQTPHTPTSQTYTPPSRPSTSDPYTPPSRPSTSDPYDDYDSVFGSDAVRSQQDNDGFLASRDTYSSSSVWTDPAWLALLATGQQLTVRIGSLVAQHEHTEVWRSACGQFALKGLRGNPAMTDVAAFVARMSALSSLSARLVAKPLAALGSSALTLRVVTAFAERGDLRSLLLATGGDNNSGMSWEEDKSVIALDVAEALEYLHSPNVMKAVVVGDLHAGHVLVNGDGHARVNLVSFSSAVCTGGQSGASSTSKKSGFSYWLSPELLEGGAATTASDVYAFGVLLCELDTGVAPFSSDGRSLPELHAGVVSGELRPSVSDSCPPRIEQLAVECMAGDPTLRPSAAQIVYRLRDIIKNDL